MFAIFLRSSLLVILSFAVLCGRGQNIKIAAVDQPLNSVLLEIRKEHGVQLSFDDALLSSCNVNLTNEYAQISAALEALVQPCGFTITKLEGVYIITPAKLNPPAPQQLRGRIIDRQNGESLPFALVQLGKSGVVSDVNGHFSFNAKDTLVSLQISYVGYQELDTLVKPKEDVFQFHLTPQTMALKEIEVVGNTSDDFKKLTLVPLIGQRAGVIKLNPTVASFLPGSSDNTLFNLIRLQAGILAAGEQTKDYIMWGSYRGQTKIVFDGITLFNASSQNDLIGAVNPLLVKDVEIHKAGYNVHIGDRVGGVVNITGRNGNYNKVSSTVKVSNETVAGVISLPVTKRSSIQGAVRKTYHSRGKFSKTPRPIENDFGDVNLKYAGETKTGNSFSINLLGSMDNSETAFTSVRESQSFDRFLALSNRQYGVSGYYAKHWKKAGVTNVNVAYSALTSALYSLTTVDGEAAAVPVFENGKMATTNSISELTIGANHILPSTDHHSWMLGIALVTNQSLYRQDTAAIVLKDNEERLQRFSTYIKDKVAINHRLAIEPGLKMDISFQSLKPYVQPRFNAYYLISNRWRMSGAWGIYNQFVVEHAYVDEYQNRFNFWSVAESTYSAPVNSMHSVLSLSYQYGSFNFTGEGFYKTTKRLGRFYFNPEIADVSFSGNGRGRSYGLDITLKRQMGKHDLWLGYTLSKTEESFSYFQTSGYQRASQDQRHEFKCAAIFNFSPFF